MPTVTKDVQDPRQFRNSVMSVDRYLRDDYFKERFSPADFEVTAGAGTFVNASNCLALSLPNGETTDVLTSRPTKGFWVNGYLTVTVILSSTTTGGNFTISLVVGTKRIGGLSTTINNLISTGIVTISEPGVANTITSISYTSPPSTLVSLDDILCFQFRRLGADAGDTATGNLRLFGMITQYHPVNSQ